MSFKRLVRFVDETDKTVYGDLGDKVPNEDITGSKVAVLDGDLESGFKPAGKEATIKKLLTPLPKVHIFQCVGLNYKHHAAEANLAIPKFPVIFTKPPDAATGPYDTISVHPEAQPMLDYEGELTVVIGKDGKNISEENALAHVLGYTVGNDVSARNFQIPADVSGNQFGYAKSFDQFGPVGPCIASTSVIPDPHAISYTTKVNGEVRQQTPTSDMIWTVKQIIAHLSRGTTLRKGTFIMTGTPSGVGIFMNPKGFLKNGDVVEINVEGIGALRNPHKFE